MIRFLAHLIGLLALLIGPLAAQDDTGGLSVSLVFPPDVTPKNYFQYQLAPGTTREDALDLTNTSRSPLKVKVYAGDGYSTPDGALTGPLFGVPSKGAGNWVAVDTQEVVLAPNQSRRVSFRFQVPADAAPGDHFAFIFLEPVDEKASQPKPGASDQPTSFRVNITQRLGICLWERVPGELTTGWKIGGARKAIEKGRLYLVLSLENTGNTYVKPTGSWTLKSPGGETVASSAPDEWGYLLPGYPMELRIPLTTTRPLARGQYQLEINTHYGDEKVSSTVPIALP